MAKTKKVETNTASIVDEKNTTVETEKTVTETSNELFEDKKEVEQKQAETKTEKPESDNKVKKFGDNDKVIVKCDSLAGKKMSMPTRTVEFDENGKCEVTGTEANRLLTIPGYELAK